MLKKQGLEIDREEIFLRAHSIRLDLQTHQEILRDNQKECHREFQDNRYQCMISKNTCLPSNISQLFKISFNQLMLQD